MNGVSTNFHRHNTPSVYPLKSLDQPCRQGALAVPEAAGIRPSTGHRTDAEASSRTKSVDAEERRLPGAAEEAQRCGLLEQD